MKLEHEVHEANKKYFQNHYIDLCIRSELYSNKRKPAKKYMIKEKLEITKEVQEDIDARNYLEMINSLNHVDV